MCKMSPQINLHSKFVPYLSLSKEEFVSVYGDFQKNDTAKQLYIFILNELKRAISEDNIKNFKKINSLIECICYMEDKSTLKDYYNDIDNSIKNTNLIILACKYNSVQILNYILCNFELLNNLSINIGKSCIVPIATDEMHHNSFYYAMLTKNVELLETLIINWPDKYFTVKLNELDALLSTTYEEIKLKNLPLSNEVELYVENKLIELRFFNTSGEDNLKCDINNVKERIELVLASIRLLLKDYLSIKTEVNDKFLFLAKFIAQNIHILKRQLKSTYDRIPWEEMEFCLLAFISSLIKKQEINLIIVAVLNKSKVLAHLEHFANKLQNCCLNVNINRISILPRLKRAKAVQIIKSDPQFENLYNDYHQIRDIHSLMKISNYINLALSDDPKTKEGQLIITRVLQVIGEYTKNTLESPKLSDKTSELLLLSLPRDTRKIIADLRNSLSHAHSLSKRAEIEENNITFFIGIQNDMKKIGDVIINILYNYKMKTTRVLLAKIAHSENFDEIIEIVKILSNIEIDEMISENFKLIEKEKLEKLVLELSNNVTEKNNYEQSLLVKINDIINFQKHNLEHFKEDYHLSFSMLKSIKFFYTYKHDKNIFKGLKFRCNHTLQILSSKIESHSLKEIVHLSLKFYESVRSRMHYKIGELCRLMSELLFVAEFETNDIKWIEELRQKLNERDPVIPFSKEVEFQLISKKKYKKQFKSKLSDLKTILNKKTLNIQLIEHFSLYKNDEKLQTAVEMLVLDIMSILSSSKNSLVNNLLYTDDNSPMLVGKCLRDHLAHGNVLVDVVLSNYSKAVYFNAKQLISENVMEVDKKIGKFIKDDPLNLKVKYEQKLHALINQERLFLALEEGNLEDAKCCLSKGADINGRNFKLWTAIHFACKGPSLDTVKFIIDQKSNFNIKNSDGHNPLHIAAAYGRRNIVKFLLKETPICINDADYRNRTPLHIAAMNGNKETVTVLLQNRAEMRNPDSIGLLPLHYAARNGHIDVVNIFLGKNMNVDITESSGGFTSLHEAAERGYLEIVSILVKNGANINRKTCSGCTPLHLAALCGHLDVVDFLISKGSDVNDKVLNGCTPLHYATENGNDNVANILLKNGAKVNVYDKTHKNMPLHYAANFGYENIAKLLLQYKANANAVTVKGVSPLHLGAQSGHLEIVRILLKYSIKINATDINESTPLHYAAKSNQIEVVDLLIKHKALINAKDCAGCTPLHIAALESSSDVAKLLLKNNAEINIKNIEGNVPLHAAAREGSNVIIELLLENKANIAVKNDADNTPLHIAAFYGHKDSVCLLIQYNADVNIQNNNKMTSLHVAAMNGHIDVLNILIKHGAEVNTRDAAGNTPLHTAVKAGYKEVVDCLVSNESIINIKDKDGMMPLFSAVKNNNKEIAELLVFKTVDKDVESFDPLILSVPVLAGNQDIVELLLKHVSSVNIKYKYGVTLLHLAAKSGHKEIMKILIKKGAVVDAKTIDDQTPLFLASELGSEEVVKILIENDATVNVKDVKGMTPLHIACIKGHSDVVKILIENNLNINSKDYENRTPIELAVANGHLQIVKILFSYKSDINAQGNDGWTLLHKAAQQSNIEILKYLINEGSDIDAKNNHGLKPIHIAAEKGLKDNVEFFLSNGCNIDDLGGANQTLLHYAMVTGIMETVKFLIAQGGDVNSKDADFVTPIHIASASGDRNLIELLLKHGAAYNAVDKFGRKPIEITENKEIYTLLLLTHQLFKSVKHSNSMELHNCIRERVILDVKDAKNGTLLHYASWKGNIEIINTLLQNKANPRCVGKDGFTPLHYASKYSHLDVVKSLLCNGAVYNATSNTNKTPLDFAIDARIAALLKFIEDSFKNVKKGNTKIIKNLNKIRDVETIKAVMNAQDKENRTLIVVALNHNFLLVNQLKEILQEGVSSKFEIATEFCSQNDFESALSIYKSVLEKRKEILGLNNPACLDIQILIAKVLCRQGYYQDAINMLKEIHQKQKDSLGTNYKDTLNTRSYIALILHRQGKNEEALNICQKVYVRQKEIFGPDHTDTLETQLYMALILDKLGKYEEALNINIVIYNARNKANHPTAVNAQNNIAMVLANQEKYEEALKIYKEVLEKKIVLFGISDASTLRTIHNIAAILLKQRKYDQALEAFEKVLNLQKNILGSNHPETKNSQYNIANIFFYQGMWYNALKTYKECLDQMKIIHGENNPKVLSILKNIEFINLKLKLDGYTESDILQYFEKNIFSAADNGDLQTVEYLLKNGTDVNDKDIEGRTALHFAISNGHLDIVNILLQNRADCTLLTNKGNTPLHIAASKGYQEITNILLQRVGRNELNEFVNSQTSGGNTALHIAAKNGFIDIVSNLLEHGAMFDLQNSKYETPLHVCTDKNIVTVLKLLEELFQDAKCGNDQIINKLETLKTSDFFSVIKARNNQAKTLVQVAISNEQMHIATTLIKILKKSDKTI